MERYIEHRVGNFTRSNSNSRHRAAVIGFSVMALSTFAISAKAQYGLGTNGGFESNTGTGQLGDNISATNWSTASYTFLFTSATAADTTFAVSSQGAPCDGSNCNLMLWGPGNGSNNGLTNRPDGGAFLASDPVDDPGPITQTINGLIVGDSYQLSFYFAAAQQYGFSGANSSGWDVSLGSRTQPGNALPGSWILFLSVVGLTAGLGRFRLRSGLRSHYESGGINTRPIFEVAACGTRYLVGILRSFGLPLAWKYSNICNIFNIRNIVSCCSL